MSAYTESDARLDWIVKRNLEGLPWPTRDDLAAFMDGFRAARAFPPEAVPPIHRPEWDGWIKFESDCLVNGYHVKAGTSWGPFEKSRNPHRPQV